jgi:hypothetical protein
VILVVSHKPSWLGIHPYTCGRGDSEAGGLAMFDERRGIFLEGDTEQIFLQGCWKRLRQSIQNSVQRLLELLLESFFYF